MNLILDSEKYSKIRSEYRNKMIELKQRRRILGPNYSIYFENYETIQYQIQEVIHLENSYDRYEEEVKAYNDLIPKDNELVITFSIEIEDKVIRNKLLKNAYTLLDDIYITDSDNNIIKSEKVDNERLSCVNFIKFNIHNMKDPLYINSNNKHINFKHEINI